MASHHDFRSILRTLEISGLAVVLFVMSVAVITTGLAAVRPISVEVDGRGVQVAQRSTVDAIRKKGLLEERPGDLLSVSGSVLTTGAGEPMNVYLNDDPARGDERIHEGDKLHGQRGGDTVESTASADAAIPFETRVDGSGPIMEVTQIGQPGLLRISKGAVSGIEVTRTVITTPTAQIVVRRKPMRGDKVIALTFDDGPWKGQTDRILDILRDKKAVATFFTQGSRVAAQPQLVAREAAEGHLVATHSYSHPRMTRLSSAAMKEEIVRSSDVVRKIIGVTPKWFRPPYGDYDSAVGAELARNKKIAVKWDVDPQDWRRPGAAKIADGVLGAAKPGAVVLLHDGGGNRDQTIEALPVIIDKLREQGYSFVTISQLMEME